MKVKSKRPESETETVYIKTNQKSDIEEIQPSRAAVYPIPFEQIIHVNCPEWSIIKIHDAMGRLVFQGEFEPGDHSIDLSKFDSGTYVLSVGGEIIRLVKINP